MENQGRNLIGEEGKSEDPFGEIMEVKEPVSAEKKLESDKLAINMGYCIGYTAVWGFGTWQTAWALSGNANTTPIFTAKLGWDKDEMRFWNTFISSSAIVGIAIGSFLGGSLLQFGRRKTVIIAMLICILGSAISMYVNEYTLCIGRLFLGTGAGIHNVAVGKLINETIPDSIMAIFAMATNASICIGLFVVFLMGVVLPDPADIQANKDDELWRIIWAAPAAIGLIEILLTLFVMRLEPIAYCMMTGNNADGNEHLRKVYRKKDSSSVETLEELTSGQYNFLKMSTSMEASSVSFKEVVCGRKYRKATWVCVGINMFNQQSGINAVNTYAGQLLKLMAEQGGDFPVTPVQGGYLIGATNAFFACVVVIWVARVGRKTQLVVGQLAMAFFLFICGLAIQNQWNLTSFIMILLFVGAFQLSQGSIAWLYVPEVCMDAGMGLAVASQFINLTLISFTFEYMIASDLQVHGSIWYFSAFCLLGFFFILFIVKETRGLSDLEKKTLYSPKNNSPEVELAGVEMAQNE